MACRYCCSRSLSTHLRSFSAGQLCQTAVMQSAIHSGAVRHKQASSLQAERHIERQQAVSIPFCVWQRMDDVSCPHPLSEAVLELVERDGGIPLSRLDFDGRDPRLRCGIFEGTDNQEIDLHALFLLCRIARIEMEIVAIGHQLMGYGILGEHPFVDC